MPSVYIETTIPSFYFETRRHPTIVAWRASTRRWWDLFRDRYELVTSRAVFNEIAESPASKAKQMIRLLDSVKILDEPPELSQIVSFYVKNKLMPADAEGDAAHLAIASWHQVDFLLTWNCRHLANMNKAAHLRVINTRLGLKSPILTTPDTLVPEQSE